MAAKKRYVQVGLGGRSEMYWRALIETYKDIADLVGFCDVNEGRLALRQQAVRDAGGGDVPGYGPADFDRMIAEQKPDVVIVTTGPDVTHSDYILRAMDLGCDVITEKPMTTDEQRCRAILKKVKETGRNVKVTFNYRYSPPRSQIKELLDAGEIGEILSVDFTWLLDTRHGADYFRRWHRDRANSGSLLVHKSTHHFDLVNWWLGDRPAEIFAFGDRRFYTPAQGDARGLTPRSGRCLDCPVKEKCDFKLELDANENLRTLYLDNEKHDGYFRDRCVFSDEINIWDTMAVSVRYAGGALLSYMLHAYSPWEGYRVAFNGSKGRLEQTCCESTYINGDGSVPGELEKGKTSITLTREFEKPVSIEPTVGEGGHGGGDPILLADLFDPNAPADPLGRAASQIDGAYSILVGIAGYHSIDEDRPDFGGRPAGRCAVDLSPASAIRSAEHGSVSGATGFLKPVLSRPIRSARASGSPWHPITETAADEGMCPWAKNNTVPAGRAILAGVLAWAIPGLGHVLLGQRLRGVIIGIAVLATFWFGMAIGGVMTVDSRYEHWWWYAQSGAGVSGVIGWIRQDAVYRQLEGDPDVAQAIELRYNQLRAQNQQRAAHSMPLIRPAGARADYGVRRRPPGCRPDGRRREARRQRRGQPCSGQSGRGHRPGLHRRGGHAQHPLRFRRRHAGPDGRRPGEAGGDVMIAYVLFTTPVLLPPAAALWLLIPLSLTVSTVYRTIRTKNVRRLPWEIGRLTVLLLIGLGLLAVALWAIQRLFL